MIRARLHRLRILLRVSVQALMLLAVLVNPVLASIGDLHAAAHEASPDAALADGHGHDASDHARDTAHDADHGPDHDAGTAGDGGDLLHALMHAAHCCGHATALLPLQPFARLATLAEPAPTSDVAAPRTSPRGDHFRPPILA